MNKFRTIEEVIETIENRRSFRQNREALLGFLEKHGNPHLSLRTIHIAGTNGKGSTTNYVSHILMEQGYKVGMFTSPYLVSHFDRIRINNQDIPSDVMLALVNEYWDDMEEFDLNMFEIDFVLATFYYLKEQVDFAVFEVGMGGRLDATNVLVPLVCGITNIGMDHMKYLGDTYAEIALEKAGIMKVGVPCFTTETKQECLKVMQEYSNEIKATFKKIDFLPVVSYPPLIVMSKLGGLELGEVALYQRENVALAIAMIESLRERGVAIGNQAIRDGVKTIWKGRFEKIRDNVYLDGAHNLEGVKALIESVNAIRGKQKIRIIFACLKDKTFDKMLELLEVCADTLLLTCIDNPRACKKEDYGAGYVVEEDYQKALEDSLKEQDELIFITGSLYFITLAKQYIETM